MIITNKSEIKKYTNLEIDKVFNITTKLYAQRSEEVKAIPSVGFPFEAVRACLGNGPQITQGNGTAG